jgi:hypothetical protein
MLNQVADGVWVRQSEWVVSNAIVVRGEGGLILVDPGIDGSDLNQLADDLDRLGIPVVAGFSTHPHWDHLLWHLRFGDVPRYATTAGAHAASQARERGQKMAAESASGIPLELFGLVTPLPADGGRVPGEIVEHQAHAIGHAAVLLADRGGPPRRRSGLHRRAAARRGTGRRASGAGCAPRSGLAPHPPVEPGAGPRAVAPLTRGPFCRITAASLYTPRTAEVNRTRRTSRRAPVPPDTGRRDLR